MISFVPRQLTHHIECPCGRWTWRELAAAFVVERRCPRCKENYLLTFRMVVHPHAPSRPTFQFVYAIKYRTRDPEGIRRSLVAPGRLNEDEADLIMHVLEQLAVPA